MSLNICPYCGNVLYTENGRCPSCGKIFAVYDWPAEAYSSDGMHSSLRLVGAGGVWIPNNREFIIGREPGNNGFLLRHPSVSREHVKISFEDDEWKIRKLGKSFLINSQPSNEAVLANNDIIQIGPFSLEVRIQYVHTPITTITNGIVKMPLSPILDLDTDRIYVGDASQDCRIVISGAAAKHCLIYCHNRTKDWWIVDCVSPSGTKVNGKRIRNERLYDGDEINVAGVSLYFYGTTIRIGKVSTLGLSLDLQHGSAFGKKTNFTILDDVSFHVNPGEFVGILGPSGCGKSSLIQRIVGLSSFDKGELTINGQNINMVRDAFQSEMSYIPQQIALHKDLTVEEEINCFCRLHNTGKFIDWFSALSVVKMMGLENEREKQVTKLSGGQKKRLAIALELLRNPRLLLLDEPTSGLDPATEKHLMTYLRRVANQKRTVICSTHIMENIGLFDKILVLSKGHVVFFGTPDELCSYFRLSSPLELYSRLDNGDADEQTHFAKECADLFMKSKFYKTSPNLPTDLPGVSKEPLVHQISGYLYRFFHEFISFRHSPRTGKFWKWDFWQSSLFIQLLLQPLLIACVIKLAYAAGFCAGTFANSAVAQVDAKKLFFFCLVVVFWLGLNNAIRELVYERVPARCLERLRRVRCSSYLIAKTIWTTGMCFVQTLLFFLFLLIPLHFKVLKPDTSYVNPLAWAMFVILCLICFTGGWLGLAISSIFKKENAAVGLLPIIMIPILFFSHLIINNSNSAEYVHAVPCHRGANARPCEKCANPETIVNNDKADLPFFAQAINFILPRRLQPLFPPAGSGERGNADYNFYAVYLETFNPCHTAQNLMDKINTNINDRKQGCYDNNKQGLADDWHRMLMVLGIWILSFFISMCIFQSKNEKNWDGR